MWNARTGSTSGTPAIQVTNTHLPSLQRLQGWFGGSVAPKKHPNPNARPAFLWGCYGPTALEVCSLLSPFLFEKKAQADLLSLIGRTRREERVPLLSALKALKRPRYAL